MTSEKALDVLKKEMTPVLKSSIVEILDNIKNTAQDYAEDIAKEYAASLYGAYIGSDAQADRNLLHLKVQVQQLAMIHEIEIRNEVQKVLEQSLAVAFRVGLALLKGL
jgi:hypothetical protein